MSASLERRQIKIGFIPLTDCAPLPVAQELGYFARRGLDVTLSREGSWATIRDKVALGALDAAHMVAPLPIACTLGVAGLTRTMVVPFSFNLNGNAITLSEDLWCRATAAGEPPRGTPLSAAALRPEIERRRAAGEPPLRFAATFPFSSHHYQLRLWLSAGGVVADRDVSIVTVPPPQMAAHLSSGRTDGYCVGEPWNQVAVDAGIGRTVAIGANLWGAAPEKVLGVAEDWAARNPGTLQAVVEALIEAARWIDDPANRGETARILAQPHYVHAPLSIVERALIGAYRVARDEPGVSYPNFHVFHQSAANFPWRSHADWFLAQMLRWGQIGPDVNRRLFADRTYRPDLYRPAAAAVDVAAPLIDRKVEGAHQQPWTLTEATAPIPMLPDPFTDASTFDPDAPEALAGAAHSARISIHQ